MQVGSGLSAETKIELFEATRMEPNVTICYQNACPFLKIKTRFIDEKHAFSFTMISLKQKERKKGRKQR